MLSNALRISLISLSLLLFCTPTHAQGYEFEPLRLELSDPTILLLDDNDPLVPKSKADYIAIYVQNCMKPNKNPAMQDYMERQCTCTAVGMADTMSEDDIVTMFMNTDRGDFQYARMLLLSYMPCMEQTIEQITLDSCLDNPQIYNERAVCSCLANKTTTFINKYGQKLIPGFRTSGFAKSDSVASPLLHTINSRAYTRKYAHYFRSCLALDK